MATFVPEVFLFWLNGKNAKSLFEQFFFKALAYS